MDDQLSFLLNNPSRRQSDGTQGSKANMTGQQAEDAIYGILRGRGYQISRQELICKSIYEGDYLVDFLVHGVRSYPLGLAIECKWQNVKGTADQKYPYVVENIRRFPCPAVVILGGGGMRPGSVRWFKSQVDGQKLLGVYTFEEFLQWAMDNL